jgi:adenosine kinase
MGCVGQDKYHQLLYDAATKAGLTLSYQVHVDLEEHVQTGTCAVLITGTNRYDRRKYFLFFIFLSIDH